MRSMPRDWPARHEYTGPYTLPVLLFMEKRIHSATSKGCIVAMIKHIAHSTNAEP